MGKLKEILRHPRIYAIYAIGRLVRGSILADELYLKMLYKAKMGKTIDFNNPKTCNEKMQWLKLHDRNPIYTTMVDKYLVKDFVSKKIGEEYIIPTLGVWECFEDIDFDNLPERFVLKCTHDSGGLVVVKDKSFLDMKEARKKIKHCMKRNYFTNTREWPYKNVRPRIIAEKFIGEVDVAPVDYKFYCFDGEIDSVMLCLNRELGKPKFVFMDMNWNRIFYQKDEPDIDVELVKPKNFDVMVDVVRKLCKGLKEIRVDLYNINGTIYFGELTFFNQSGFDVDITYETDLMWGEKIKLF